MFNIKTQLLNKLNKLNSSIAKWSMSSNEIMKINFDDRQELLELSLKIKNNKELQKLINWKLNNNLFNAMDSILIRELQSLWASDIDRKKELIWYLYNSYRKLCNKITTSIYRNHWTNDYNELISIAFIQFSYLCHKYIEWKSSLYNYLNKFLKIRIVTELYEKKWLLKMNHHSQKIMWYIRKMYNWVDLLTLNLYEVKQRLSLEYNDDISMSRLIWIFSAFYSDNNIRYCSSNNIEWRTIIEQWNNRDNMSEVIYNIDLNINMKLLTDNMKNVLSKREYDIVLDKYLNNMSYEEINDKYWTNSNWAEFWRASMFALKKKLLLSISEEEKEVMRVY